VLTLKGSSLQDAISDRPPKGPVPRLRRHRPPARSPPRKHRTCRGPSRSQPDAHMRDAFEKEDQARFSTSRSGRGAATYFLRPSTPAPGPRRTSSPDQPIRASSDRLVFSPVAPAVAYARRQARVPVIHRLRPASRLDIEDRRPSMTGGRAALGPFPKDPESRAAAIFHGTPTRFGRAASRPLWASSNPVAVGAVFTRGRRGSAAAGRRMHETSSSRSSSWACARTTAEAPAVHPEPSADHDLCKSGRAPRDPNFGKKSIDEVPSNPAHARSSILPQIITRRCPTKLLHNPQPRPPCATAVAAR